MSVIGDFTIPAEAFGLEHALSAVPAMTVEGDRLASHSPQEVIPFLWGRGGDHERFRRALADDPAVAEAHVAEATETEVLYRLVWSDSFCDLIHNMIDHHAVILNAEAARDQWSLRLRFAEEEMVSRFQSHFRETGRQFEVQHLSRSTESRQRVFGLMAEQHEALVLAADEGYFAVPRAVSLEELSEELGISPNAVSERIRRGCESLVQSGLMTPAGEG